ncbi:MAG: hypothetical protein KC994_05500, partial [Candidatus Omnitrophica bacterium]|nr:hypothetical protein [Candidatus Omnitrophota bacterium]
MNKSPNSLLEIRDSLLLAMGHAEKQVSEMTPKWPAGSPAPIYTVDGKWFRQKSVWTDWTPGFYAGMMWMLFESTG